MFNSVRYNTLVSDVWEIFYFIFLASCTLEFPSVKVSGSYSRRTRARKEKMNGLRGISDQKYNRVF